MRSVMPIGAVCAALVGCGGGGDPAPQVTNNDQNQWVMSGTNGYSGGNVVFAGQKIVGEWSTQKTSTKNGTGNSFASTSNYIVGTVKFDDVRYSEYWIQISLVGGKVVSNAAWTPIGSYGVSKDGSTLTVDKYSSKKSYTANGTHTYNGKECVTVTEVETGDEYDICKV